MAWMEKLMMQVALVDSVTKPLAGIERQMAQVNRSGREGWRSMAMGATTVAAGGMAIQGALQPAIDMDRALGEVESLGVAQDTLKALGQTALQFSIDYGRSATDFVRASYDIQSAIAGLEGDELPKFARASGVLAAATKADTGTITNYMGTMYGIFEQQATAMGKANWVESLTGKTALAVQMFKTTGQGMADAFGAIGANATAAGVDWNEQFAVLGMLQSTMGGGEAGTKFKAFLSGVGNAQKTLGMQFTDSAGKMLPVLDILDKLKQRYGDTMTIAEGDELKKAFGSDEAVAMIKQLMTNTKGLANNINALANTHGMGKAEQMAASMTDQWQRVEQGWFAIRAAAFSTILPAVSGVMSVVASFAGTVLRWTQLFPNLTRVISYAIMGIIGLGMVTGSWMLIAGVAQLAMAGWGIVMAAVMVPLNLLKAGLVAFRAIMLAVNIAMYANPMGLIVLAIVALVAAVGAVIYWWDDLKRSLADMAVFQALGKAIDWLISKINMIPGIDIKLDDAPSLQAPMPQQQRLMSPIANYRQPTPYAAPAGGLGQQLIQANAKASAANQKPSKSMQIGEVHNHFQNPMTPEQMAENQWLETQG
jgi:TP901 family phage tail tape measure protein